MIYPCNSCDPQLWNSIPIAIFTEIISLSQPSVAIVILNWNGRKYLEQFLPSVLATAYANKKVIVADNASTDDSLSYLQAYFPQVERLVLDRNYGFAGGYNEALRHVTADYFVLLNSDVEVAPNWINPMVDLLERDNRAAACQPKILSYHDRSRFEYAGAAGGWIDSCGYPFSRGRIFEHCEVDTGQYDADQKVFWASGAALMIRSSVYQELDGFDDFLFAHQEEIDLCWRAQRKGYTIWCCPASVVYHVGGGALPRGNSRKTFLNFRNNQVLLYKNLPMSEKWWKIPFRMALDQVAALKMLLSGDGGYFIAVIRAHLAFIKWVLVGRKQPFVADKPSLKKLDGVLRGNIVWEHFIKGKTRFDELDI